jgi:hypothetical protein
MKKKKKKKKKEKRENKKLKKIYLKKNLFLLKKIFKIK